MRRSTKTSFGERKVFLSRFVSVHERTYSSWTCVYDYTEFVSRFQRLWSLLFPFAFHCTGMRFQASANKLKDEIAKFGLKNCMAGVFEEPVCEAGHERGEGRYGQDWYLQG